MLRSLGTGPQQADRAWLRTTGLTALVLGALAVLPAPAAADSWTLGPVMLQQHVAGVSAELADGSVLVAAGDNTNSPEGELLPPNAGGPFAPAGQMVQERIFPAATVLHNGDVLIAGGDDTPDEGPPGVPNTAEVWNPQSGFTATGLMNASRQVFTLTTLPDGQALAVGGSPYFQSGAGWASAELFNPVTNRWTRTGSMPSGRLGHTATLLPDCRVLVVGDAGTAVTYNYVTGKFLSAGTEGLFKRSYPTATLLANGRVLIAGGETGKRVALNTASVWNPATNTFKPTANNMSTPHVQGFAARLPDGRVVVGGGFYRETNPPAPTDNVDIYNPATNRWSPAASLPSGSDAISAEVQTLQNGNVIVMGTGLNGHGTDIYHHSALGPTVSPPAQNCANLTHPFVVNSVKPAARHTIRVTVSVPMAGKLTAIGLAQPWRTSTPKRWFSFGSAKLSVPHAGRYILTISPASRARSLLRSGRTLRVKVTTAYGPTVGPGKSKTVTVRVGGG